MGYNEISAPGYQNLVRRVFGLTGPGGNIPTVAPEIQGIAILQPANKEHDRLRGEDILCAGTFVTGTGATRPYVGLLNPAASNRVVVLELVRATVWDSAVANLPGFIKIDLVTNLTAFLGAVQIPAPRDTRLSQVAGWAGNGAQYQTGNVGGAIPTGFVVDTFSAGVANVITARDYADIVLTPGWGIIVGHAAAFSATANVGAHFRWFEKLFEPQESTA